MVLSGIVAVLDMRSFFESPTALHIESMGQATVDQLSSCQSSMRDADLRTSLRVCDGLSWYASLY